MIIPVMRQIPVGGGSYSDLRGYRCATHYGEPPANGSDLDQQMSVVVQQLRDAYQQGLKAIQDAHGTGALDWVLGDSAQYNSNIAAYQSLPKYIDQLDGDLRQVVLSGVNQAGNPYDVSQWIDFAKTTVMDAIESISKVTVNATGIQVLAQTGHQTAHDLNPLNRDSPLNPGNWPWYVWVAAGGLTLVAMGPVLNLASALLRRKPSAA